MSMQLQRVEQHNLRAWLEEILLKLADMCNIQIVWDADVAIGSGVLAAVGGLVGALVGGRLGATVGVGLGGYLGISTGLKPFREVWPKVKSQLEGLLDVILDFLKSINKHELLKAFVIILECVEKRKILVEKICAFVGENLAKKAVSEYSNYYALKNQ